MQYLLHVTWIGCSLDCNVGIWIPVPSWQVQVSLNKTLSPLSSTECCGTYPCGLLLYLLWLGLYLTSMPVWTKVSAKWGCNGTLPKYSLCIDIVNVIQHILSLSKFFVNNAILVLTFLWLCKITDCLMLPWGPISSAILYKNIKFKQKKCAITFKLTYSIDIQKDSCVLHNSHTVCVCIYIYIQKYT